MSLKLELDAETLAPLVEKVVAATLAKVETAQRRLDDRLAIPEPEAARLLSLNPHQLRDERLRGRIRASAIVGGRIRYQREDLMKYLAERTFQPPN